MEGRWSPPLLGGGGHPLARRRCPPPSLGGRGNSRCCWCAGCGTGCPKSLPPLGDARVGRGCVRRRSRGSAGAANRWGLGIHEGEYLRRECSKVFDENVCRIADPEQFLQIRAWQPRAPMKSIGILKTFENLRLEHFLPRKFSSPGPESLRPPSPPILIGPVLERLTAEGPEYDTESREMLTKRSVSWVSYTLADPRELGQS